MIEYSQGNSLLERLSVDVPQAGCLTRVSKKCLTVSINERLSSSFLGATSAGAAAARVTKTRAMKNLRCIFLWSNEPFTGVCLNEDG